jgi:hypothetical protein
LTVTWNLQKCGSQANFIEPGGESNQKSETHAGLTFSGADEFFEPLSIFKPVDIFSTLFPR